ncbi:hypothetical protein [Polyangium spumosum]|nr:hypothetical protein [Polyangium spumosum]
MPEDPHVREWESTKPAKDKADAPATPPAGIATSSTAEAGPKSP